MMEYLDGGSLQDIADNGGVRDEGVLANIAKQVLSGLDFLHNCNQIHRGVCTHLHGMTDTLQFLVTLLGVSLVSPFSLLIYSDVYSSFSQILNLPIC